MRHPSITLLGLSLVTAGCATTSGGPPPQPAPVYRATTVPVDAVGSPRPAAPEPEPAPPAASSRQADNLLAAGLEAYENGNYAVAEQKFEGVLERPVALADRLTALKYLAFIACASGRMDVCEAHFQTILALDRRFTLTAAEAGHPRWGPVFRRLKAERNRAPGR